MIKFLICQKCIYAKVQKKDKKMIYGGEKYRFGKYPQKIRKKRPSGTRRAVVCSMPWLCAFNFVDDSLEGFRIVEGEIGKDFAIDLDTCFVDEAHELGVAEVMHAGSSVDTLNPKGTEVAFFVLTVTVSIGKTFLPCVFGNGPYITAASEVAAGKF